MMCSVEGCEKKAYVRGWCQMHYTRWLRHGDPSTVLVSRGSPGERFLSKFEVGAPDECWPWQGRTDKGYGQFNVGGGRERSLAAHRFSYEHFVGPIPEGLHIDHICHDPKVCPGGPTCPHRRCVNPAHLLPGPPENNKSGERSWYAAKTHCPRGHAYDEDNTYITKEGHRDCRACHRIEEMNRRRNTTP